jgi:hypothetical protein
MSALGQKRTNCPGPKFGFVRFGPKADIDRPAMALPPAPPAQTNVPGARCGPLRQHSKLSALPPDVSSGGKKAWANYRSRLDRLANAENDYKRLAGRASATFAMKATKHASKKQKEEPKEAPQKK